MTDIILNDEVKKIERGRPVTLNVKENKDYFKLYYHETKENFVCLCGAFINNHSKNKHLKTKKHNFIIENFNLIKKINNNL